MSLTTLGRIRGAALAVGCISLFAAILVVPEERTARDWLWSIGVAALLFTLVVNRIIRRQAKKEEADDTVPR